MLTEDQFAEQQRALGYRIHEHDGVFWEEVYPFYCKPAFPFRAVDRGAARPARLRCLLGYSHRVPRIEQGNRNLPIMLLEREQLEGFSLQSLSAKKRNQVRRAMERCKIQPIVDIELHLERIREINVAQSLRQEQGSGSEVPPARYIDEADDWRRQIRREFTVEIGREWWGAFVDGELAAYIRTYQVDSVRVIQQAKADTEYFRYYPVDALYFTVLSIASEDAKCQCIVNGYPMHQSLNRFKENFLFKPTAFPVFDSCAWLVELGKKLIRKTPDRSISSTIAEVGDYSKKRCL